MFRQTLAVLALAAALVPAAQAAPVSALTFTSADSNSTCCNSTRGYAFDVLDSGLFATHLGIWDAGSDGLARSHDVGLWDSLGVLVASVTVPGGAAAALVDGFRYVDIADVALSTGRYTVGAVFFAGGTDDQARSLVGTATASGISFVGARFINNGVASLTNPTESLSITGLMGGSLMVDRLNGRVPEPGALSLIALALGAAGVAVRRRKA